MLVAVRRAENGEDRQPHPSFCVIRAGDWERLRGDWSMGHCWETEWGELVSDSGGNLLATLERNGEKWTPLLRSNRHNPHPLWFAIYGDVLYHHGAGFRIPVARSISSGRPRRRGVGQRRSMIGTTVRKLDSARVLRWQNRQMAASRKLGDRIFEQLTVDPDFYQQFLKSDPTGSPCGARTAVPGEGRRLRPRRQSVELMAGQAHQHDRVTTMALARAAHS